jgi:hypothetical protein
MLIPAIARAIEEVLGNMELGALVAIIFVLFIGLCAFSTVWED